MVEPTHPRLPIARQCLLRGISRSTFYYEAGESPRNLELSGTSTGSSWRRPSSDPDRWRGGFAARDTPSAANGSPG